MSTTSVIISDLVGLREVVVGNLGWPGVTFADLGYAAFEFLAVEPRISRWENHVTRLPGIIEVSVEEESSGRRLPTFLERNRPGGN